MTPQLSQLPPVCAAVLDFLTRYRRFLVLGHTDPDGDCVGSQLGLALGLRRLGKSVIVANEGPFDRQEIRSYAERFTQFAVDPNDFDAVVVLDCSTVDRIGFYQSAIVDKPVAVIDHHTSGTPFGDVRFVHPDIPATAMLVYTIICELVGAPSTEEAQLLFLGIATDTGFFRFVDEGSDLVFQVAAALTRAGASPRAVDTAINSGRSLASRYLIARMIDRVEVMGNQDALLTYQTRKDEREFGTRRDSDALYRLLLQVERVRVLVVVKERANGCAISFRSTDDINVGEIAAEFGGGGHPKAAGAFISDDLNGVLDTLRERLELL